MKKGEIYAVDLGVVYRQTHKALRGKYIVAWCDGPTGMNDSYGKKGFSFGVGDALFDTRPTLADVRKRKPKLLVRILDNPKGLAAVYRLYQDDDLERGVTLLGELATLAPLTRTQKSQGDHGQWYNVAQEWQFEWRVRNDGAALKAAQEAGRKKESRAAAAATAKRRAGGLAGLARRTLAPDLTGLVSSARANALRAILKRAIAELLKTTPGARRKTVLKSTVAKLNAYDEKHDGFIETPEREALLMSLEDIAVASGLGEMTAELAEWRDW
jgi:hypothetical protein